MDKLICKGRWESQDGETTPKLKPAPFMHARIARKSRGRALIMNMVSILIVLTPVEGPSSLLK